MEFLMYSIVVLKPGMNYVSTDVKFEKSKEQIKTLLKKFGCSRIVDFEDITAGFSKIAFEKDRVPFVIEFPITYVERGGKYNKTKELNMKISGRIIHDRIKSLLIAIEINYLDFTQAMMPFIALPSAEGMKPLETIVMEQEETIKCGRFELDPTKLIQLPKNNDNNITTVEGVVVND